MWTHISRPLIKPSAHVCLHSTHLGRDCPHQVRLHSARHFLFFFFSFRSFSSWWQSAKTTSFPLVSAALGNLRLFAILVVTLPNNKPQWHIIVVNALLFVGGKKTVLLLCIMSPGACMLYVVSTMVHLMQICFTRRSKALVRFRIHTNGMSKIG